MRQSVHPEIFAGDTIVEIEGQSAEHWYAETMSRYSASSEGYLFVQATYELTDVYGSKALTLRGIDGEERSISAIPQSYDQYLQFELPVVSGAVLSKNPYPAKDCYGDPDFRDVVLCIGRHR